MLSNASSVIDCFRKDWSTIITFVKHVIIKRDDIKSVFEGVATKVDLTFVSESQSDALTALIDAKEEAKFELKRKLEEYGNIKWYINMVMKLMKFDEEDEEIELKASFQSEVEVAFNEENVREQYDRGVDLIESKIKEFISQESVSQLEKS